MTDTPDLASLLAQAPASDIKQLADGLLESLGPVTVLQNRTGIVMLPATDTVQGTVFHIGEVLIAEAHVRLDAHAVEGYGACLGRDLQQALAMALLDAAWRAGLQREPIAAFVETVRADLAAVEATLTRKVEATRVEMETY